MSDPSAPAPQAGREGDEEQEPRTEEERMMEEISKQRDIIDALAVTDDGSLDLLRRRAPHQKKLGRLEFQYQLLVEQKRLANALSRFEEEHGAVYTEPCLVCLEDIHVHAAMSLTRVFGCCGGFICTTCERDIQESVAGLGKCPLCRESIGGKTEAESAAQLMALAERGVLLAQSHVAACMLRGSGGFEKNAKSGVEWINKAAAQNEPSALFQLSILHRQGLKSLVRKSQEKANELLLESANLGYTRANAELAKLYLSGTGGFEADKDEAYFRASVALALDGGDGAATMVLGTLHFFEHLPKPSFYLACYYSNIAASEDTTGVASQIYSRSLLQLAVYLHGDNSPNGYNAMPAAHIWLRKSCEMVSEDTRMLLKTGLKNVDHHFQSSCGNCSRMAEAGEKYKQCSKCKAQWYCSKECQVEAWRAGHKQDCKRATILKFEDYINAE